MRLVRDRGRCKLHAYCAVEGCTNTRRLESAAKYCDEHATCIDYKWIGPRVAATTCVICDAPGQGNHRGLRLCAEHRKLRDLLNGWRYTYKLSDGQIRSLVTEAVCWICGRSVAWRFDHNRFDAAAADRVHVDHDRRCCKGSRSCGDCVRGLAHQHCNARLGPMEKLLAELGPERMRKLIDELATPP